MSSQTKSYSERGYWLGVALVFAVTVLFFFVFKDRYINHDTGWYLVATRQWLEGARLYVDLIEVNPPLNFYLTIPAIWAADGLNITDSNGQYFVLSCLMLLSLIWVWNLLEKTPRLGRSQRMALLLGSATALIVPAINHAGQREQIMLVLILPYVMGYFVLPEPDRGPSAILRATVCAVGLCIKPYFLLIPLAVTCVHLFNTRSVRTLFSHANITMFVVGLAYLALVKLVHPEYLDSIVPMAVLVYGDYGFDWLTVVRVVKPALILLFFITMIVASLTHELPNIAIPISLVLAGLGIYAAQWTGYGYQAIPIHSFAILGYFWVLVHLSKASLPVFLTAAGLTLTGIGAVQGGFYKSPYTDAISPLVHASTQTPKIMVFSSTLGVSFPMVLETEAEWTSSYPSLWLVPGVVNGLARTDCDSDPERCADLNQILDRTRNDIAQDMMMRAPNILIVDKLPPYFDAPFDYYRVMHSDPRLAGELEKFDRVHTNEYFDFFVRR